MSGDPLDVIAAQPPRLDDEQIRSRPLDHDPRFVEHQSLGNVLRQFAAGEHLLELAEHFGHARDGSWTVEVPLSQAELGTVIGASRQSVNSALMAFRDAGWLRQEGTMLTLVHPDLLRREAEASEER